MLKLEREKKRIERLAKMGDNSCSRRSCREIHNHSASSGTNSPLSFKKNTRNGSPVVIKHATYTGSVTSVKRPFSDLSNSVERAIANNSIGPLQNSLTETMEGIDPNFNYSPKFVITGEPLKVRLKTFPTKPDTLLRNSNNKPILTNS